MKIKLVPLDDVPFAPAVLAVCTVPVAIGDAVEFCDAPRVIVTVDEWSVNLY